MKRLRLSLVLVCLGLAVWSLSGVAFAQIAYERRTVLDWSSDGQFITLGSRQGVLKIFMAHQKLLMREFQAHLGGVKALKWGGNVILSAGNDD